MVDCIYVAAAEHDACFTRTCVASIRHFYPRIPIRLLLGGTPQPGLLDELRYWGVDPEDIPPGQYGWGFVKLEPLFKPPGERFLVLDSDTVITGPVLQWATKFNSDFIVDNEILPEAREKEIYYDHLRTGSDGGPSASPAFLFNTGQWFGRSGVINRGHFGDEITWHWPRKLVRPDVFKNGDQGIFNFVLNEQVRMGHISLSRVELMRWPPNGMDGLEVDSLVRGSCPPLVVHWAGMSRRPPLSLPGADCLAYFDSLYRKRVPRLRDDSLSPSTGESTLGRRDQP